jgi:hypothetical protein
VDSAPEDRLWDLVGAGPAGTAAVVELGLGRGLVTAPLVGGLVRELVGRG